MPETRTGYTATDALRALNGISKKRFYAMMKNGDVSYSMEQWGNGTRRIIEGSELARVFGDRFNPNETSETGAETVSSRFSKPLETNETTSETIGLQVEVQVLRKEVAMKDELIHSLKEEKDGWKQQAQTLLLQAPKNEAVQATDGSDVGNQSTPHQSFLPMLVTCALTVLAVSLVIQHWDELESRVKDAINPKLLAEHTAIEHQDRVTTSIPSPHRMSRPDNDISYTPIPSRGP